MVEPSASPSARQVWDVGALLLATGDMLQARFGAVTVKGELSGMTRAASGHRYFALKDMHGASALLRCAMFRRATALLDFDAQDGQQVELRGRLGVYEPRGELQLVVESMQRLGAGALYEQYLRLKARLEAAGLFDAARKRPIAAWPSALGIVTSTAAAALHDVLATLARRAPHVRVIVYPSAVQGGDAAVALVAALRIAAVRREVDTLLLVRGGGSLEDLWPFNDEALVRAIVASPIPVICGVGHESDVTLSDLAADLRAATPTAAAELAAPARADALARLDGLAALLQRRVRQLTDTQAQRLDALALRLGGPARALGLQRQLLDSTEQRLRLALRQATMAAAREPAQWGARLVRAMHRQQELQSQRLQSAAQRLAALDPQRVLARGYAWVADAHGQPVLSSRSVRPGQHLRTQWADGAAQVEVLQVQASAPPEPATPQ
ncbi:MAG TPA: exodeoxyribonuclease VII large subunit [Rubrivivax sp.]|nr:exodeoxyribonuclease VII large subunit [Rubrivivax sp.]